MAMKSLKKAPARNQKMKKTDSYNTPPFSS
jgi:hypothetical protein